MDRGKNREPTQEQRCSLGSTMLEICVCSSCKLFCKLLNKSWNRTARTQNTDQALADKFYVLWEYKYLWLMPARECRWWARWGVFGEFGKGTLLWTGMHSCSNGIQFHEWVSRWEINQQIEQFKRIHAKYEYVKRVDCSCVHIAHGLERKFFTA